MISDEAIEETKWFGERDYQEYRKKKVAEKVRGFYVTKNSVLIEMTDGQKIPLYDDKDSEIHDRLIDKYRDVIKPEDKA